MSLSLEVRKFINSQHVGEFVDVTLPGELPVKKDEVRTVQKDNAAAKNAKRKAKEVSNAMESAVRAAEIAEQELKNAKESLAKAARELSEREARERELKPTHEQKNAAARAAEKEYLSLKEESDKLNALFAAAEKSRKLAEDAYSKQAAIAAGKRAELESAIKASADAAKNEAETRSKLDSARDENVKSEVFAGKTANEAGGYLKQESEKAAIVSELTAQAAQLTGEKGALSKRLGNLNKANAKNNKELNRLQLENANLQRQYDAAKALSESKSGEEKQAAVIKMNGIKVKLDSTASSIKNKQERASSNETELSALNENMHDLEKRIAQNAELLRAAQREHDEAKQKAKRIAEADAEEKARLASKNAAFSALTEQLSRAENAGSAARTAEQEANASAAAADVEAARLKDAFKAAEAEAANCKESADAAQAKTDAAEKVFKSKQNEFETEDVRLKAVQSEIRTSKNTNNTLSERVAKLEEKHRIAVEKRDKAIKDSKFADSEADRLKKSVHVIQTKYETARMHYMESGKGEPIILIHSAGQSLYTFRRIFYKLAMNYRVIALDLVGHGYSDRPYIFDYTVSDHVESIVRFMDALGIETANLLGFSMGAGFALEVARLHPDRVSKLILLCPGGITNHMPLSVRMMESSLFGAIASRVFSIRSVDKMLNECVFDHTVIEQHDIDQYYRPASDPGGRYAIRRTINSFDEEKIVETLREIETPSLLLWGDDDKWRPISGSEVYSYALRNCEYTVVRNTGHLLHEERPDRVCELIRKFIPAGYDTEEY